MTRHFKNYKLIRELPTGRGFADVVFLPLPAVNKPAVIVELKYDKPADEKLRIMETEFSILADDRMRGDVNK